MHICIYVKIERTEVEAVVGKRCNLEFTYVYKNIHTYICIYIHTHTYKYIHTCKIERAQVRAVVRKGGTSRKNSQKSV